MPSRASGRSTCTTRARQETSSGLRPVSSVGSVKKISSGSPMLTFSRDIKYIPRSDRFTVSPLRSLCSDCGATCDRCAEPLLGFSYGTLTSSSDSTLYRTGMAYAFRVAIRRSNFHFGSVIDLSCCDHRWFWTCLSKQEGVSAELHRARNESTILMFGGVALAARG